MRRIRQRPLYGRTIDGAGHPHTAALYSDELLAALLAGDLSPLLRADMVTAVRAAVTGDTAPLARVLALAGGPEGGSGFDSALNLATTCEDEAFNWSRGASPAVRLGEQLAAARALPESAFAPFFAANAFDLGSVRECASWPYLDPSPPPPPATMPAVPALILSGASDLRTPTADARALAAQIPGSRLVVVPDTGHSVLSQSACARAALQAFFAAKPIAPCHQEPLPEALRPPPLPPRSIASVSPQGGDRGLPGRTVHAVELTLQDFSRQLLLQLLSAASGELNLVALPSLRGGGLRGGWERFSNGSLTLHAYSYVPGVTLSGTIDPGGAGVLGIGGTSAAHGSLRREASGELRGTLAGRSVRLRQPATAAAAIVVPDALARPHPALRDAAGGAARAGEPVGVRRS